LIAAGETEPATEFFRSWELQAAERATHTLRIESAGRVASTPVIVGPS